MIDCLNCSKFGIIITGNLAIFLIMPHTVDFAFFFLKTSYAKPLSACPLRLPSPPALSSCPPRLPSPPALPACPPRLPSRPALPACPPRLPSPPALPACPPHLPSPPALPASLYKDRHGYILNQMLKFVQKIVRRLPL